ncbi:RidA family protein [Burkholderia sp. L27(2015)]|jgi:enamine deaminase RidA (YjgF/YER057c/UK114 family)|uniref:RidA family protein n=1 Tax=Burkholderia sp. L27(2015) TaxID=1641858 RepID=UPI00131CAD41|nr:RidA family protein [Burkholderia sp. L27(2015)]
MSDIKRIHPSTRMSRVVVYNGMVFIGGQTATDRTEDAAGQTRQVLAKIDGFLADAGIDKTRLLTAQIWLKDIDADFASMNAVWDAWVAPDCAPTRATVESKLAQSDLLVEISVTAAAL